MKKPALGVSLVAAALSACSSLSQIPTAKLASGTFHLGNGIPAGTILVTAAGDRVTVSLAATGLTEGTHGVHLHTTGKCETPDFASAGGHLNPASHQHGILNPAGSHLGDLPNLEIDKQGRGALSAELKGSLADARTALFDSDGTAVVIHAGPDDYKTDPSGNSGSRIACAVLRQN